MAIPGESEYIYGFHDPGNWRWIFTEKGRTAWVLVTEGIGHNPNEHSSPDYREWSTAGFGVIVRLNHSYSPDGTLPVSDLYDNFARRCANHVADSQGAHIWIIGNEMNHANEQPGVRFEGGGFTADELITPDRYAACFKKVRAAIKSVPGHANDQVVLGAVAPYTAVIRYPGNEGASWIKYFTDVLKLIGSGLDGIALHAYTHGADPNLIFDETQPWPQFPGTHYHFRAYRDFMRVIPGPLRSLPIYLTETDQSDDGQGHILPWADTNSGWVRNAYREINAWNVTSGNQQIRCLLLYRWSRADDWYIEGKRGVIDDMKQAADFGYKWNPAVTIRPFVTANDNVNVRSGPGTHFERIGRITQGSTHELAGRNEDSSWLQIPYPDASGRGWVSAQFVTVAGDIGSVSIVSAPPPDRPAATTRNVLNIRSGAGTQFERIGALAAGATVEILGRTADNAWLQIAYPDANGRGWIAAQFTDVSGNLANAPVVGAPPAPAPARPTAAIGDSLNVRSGPGTQYPRVGMLAAGATVDVVGRNSERTWLQIPYPDASGRGWITAQFASVSGDLGLAPVVSAPPAPTPAPPARPVATTSDSVNVRSGPGTQYPRTGLIRPGTQLDILGRSADRTWLQIAYPDASSRGWISAQFAAVEGDLSLAPIASAPSAPTPAPTPAPVKTTATATSALSVRSGPGTQYGGVGQLRQGSQVEIVGRSADQGWLQIAYPDATHRAWISAQFVTVSGNLAAVPIVSAAPPPAPSPAPPPPAGESIRVGGHTLSGDFLKFYRANAPLTGVPISDAATEGGVLTQYFEAMVLQAMAGGVRPAAFARELLDARRTIVALRAHAPGGVDFPPSRFGFEIQDVSGSLPANADRKWPKRSSSEIAFVVIHHTVASATLPPEELARAMVERQDKPGIKYHFYIPADGKVYQTLALDALTDHAAGQSRTSVGVALAGTFTGGALPTDAQIASAGRLCAWLAVQLGLPISRIRGMSEIVPTFQSPGDQWTQGANWKARLAGTAQAAIDAVRSLLPLTRIVSVPQPGWSDRTQTLLTYNKLPVGQKLQGDSLVYPTRPLDSIRYIVVHSSNARPEVGVDQIANYQVRTRTTDASGQVTKEQWPGIGYHFFIAADGSITKCNELTTVCYHVGRLNAASVGVCFAGNFGASGAPPTGQQIAAGGHLIAYLMDWLNLELDAVKGHQELEATDDPGQWITGFAWRHMLMGAVGAELTLSS